MNSVGAEGLIPRGLTIGKLTENVWISKGTKMTKKTDNPMSLAGRLGVFLACLAILYVIFTKVILVDHVIETPQTQEFNKSIEFLTPLQIGEALQAKQKPTMLVVYASWCGYCKRMLPGVVELIRAGQLDFLAPVFVSLDTDARALSSYLVPRDFHKIMTPYVLKDHDIDGFEAFMKPSGSKFDGGIPYIAFFDPHGKLVEEFAGVVNKGELLNAAIKLK
jgi:thiol-disulfide isomerase/thioredoxin